MAGQSPRGLVALFRHLALGRMSEVETLLDLTGATEGEPHGRGQEDAKEDDQEAR